MQLSGTLLCGGDHSAKLTGGKNRLLRQTRRMRSWQSATRSPTPRRHRWRGAAGRGLERSVTEGSYAICSRRLVRASRARACAAVRRAFRDRAAPQPPTTPPPARTPPLSSLSPRSRRARAPQRASPEHAEGHRHAPRRRGRAAGCRSRRLCRRFARRRLHLPARRFRPSRREAERPPLASAAPAAASAAGGGAGAAGAAAAAAAAAAAGMGMAGAAAHALHRRDRRSGLAG